MFICDLHVPYLLLVVWIFFWIALFATLTFAACASSEQVVVMQTTDCNCCVWSWSTYHFTCNVCHLSGVITYGLSKQVL